MCNHKGFLSQNCLFICDFNFDFIYLLCGWDGSVADAVLWKDAVENDIEVPTGKYLLGDAGFASCNALLVPYHGVLPFKGMAPGRNRVCGIFFNALYSSV